MRKALLGWVVSLALLIPPFAVPPARAQSRADAIATGDGRIEEIVVRARKRDELLEDTPVSVTALSSASLRQNVVTRLDEIQDLVPNLSFYSGRTGLTSAVFIRGVGQVDPVITFDPGVGIYVDGVFLSRQAGGVLNVVDIEQVEVLRGPQGSLFGKNTVGGAILVKTVRPRDAFEGLVRVGAGSFDTVRARFTLNAPIELGTLEDRLFSRFTFAQESSRGYSKNTFLDRYRNDVNSLGFLGALRFVATDDLELNVSGNWFRDQTNGKGGRCVVATDPPPLGGLVNAALPDECRRSRKFRFESNQPGLSDIETYGVWGDATQQLDQMFSADWLDDLSVKWISSWREQRPRLREDGDGTKLLELELSEANGGGPFDGGPGYQRQISQELQINAAVLENRLSAVAGVFGFWEEASTFQSIRSLVTVPAVLGATTDSRTSIDNSSWALFGQATFDVFDWFSLTGGARYTEEKKGFARLRTIPREILEPDEDLPPLVDADETAVFKAWTFMGNASLRAPEATIERFGFDSLLTYFTVSQGFKGGGFNGNVLNGDSTSLEPVRALESFRPETLDSFEVGIKLVAFDRRLSLNGALFRSNYDDIQVAVIDSGASVLAEIFVENAAGATVEGAEIEIDARPFSGLSVRGSVGILDTKYDSFPNAPSAAEDKQIDRTGQSFNNVPELETQLSVGYAFDTPDLGWDVLQGTVTPMVQHSYRSKVHYQGPELVQAVQLGYHLLHARLTYAFNEDRTELSVWGRNLTDQTYFQQNFPTANTLGVVLQYFEAPRSFGFELAQRF